MKKTSVRVHSVPALFSLLLFGLFALFLQEHTSRRLFFPRQKILLTLLLHILLQNSVSMILLEESLLIN